jgi:hypothetical protein
MGLHRTGYYFEENKPNQTEDNLPFLNIPVFPLFFLRKRKVVSCARVYV